jgi:hypothetical protein
MAGAALFLLRISVAATLVANGTAHRFPVMPFWILLTPYCAAFSGLIQMGIAISIGSGSRLDVAISSLDSFVLAVLGPGAYSVDARLFGRRLLTFPPRE